MTESDGRSRRKTEREAEGGFMEERGDREQRLGWLLIMERGTRGGRVGSKGKVGLIEGGEREGKG